MTGLVFIIYSLKNIHYNNNRRSWFPIRFNCLFRLMVFNISFLFMAQM